MRAVFRMAGAISAALLMLSLACIAQAAEIKVLGALGMKAILEDLGTKFERATRHKLAITFLPLGATLKLVQSGETADVVIIPQQGMDGFVKDSKVIFRAA